MCFSQIAFHESFVKDATISVDAWKRLVQNFAKSWRFLGFIHDASGQCIIHVPPPISVQIRKNSTKVRLYTEYGEYDVFAGGALPLRCKMRLVPISSTTNSSDQAPVIFRCLVKSDAPSVVKDCLNDWKDGVVLDIHIRRLFDRHASCQWVRALFCHCCKVSGSTTFCNT